MEVKIRTKQELEAELKKDGPIHEGEVEELHKNEVKRWIGTCKNVADVNAVKAACKKAGWPEPMVHKIRW